MIFTSISERVIELMESDADSSIATVTSSNVTPASSFVNLFLNEINNQDIRGLLDVQSSLIEQLDKTNDKLDNANKLSAKNYLNAARDFSCHTQMLKTMKTDLDIIFKRIKILKMRLSKKYPEALASTVRSHAQHNDLLDDEDDNDDDDDIDDLMPSTKSVASATLVKSKTIDCSQFSPSMRESYSTFQISGNDILEQTASSFGAVRRFVIDKSSSSGQNFTTFFKSAQDEFKKINDSLLGSTKPPNDNTEH